MTKAENRAAAGAYQAEKQQRWRKERRRAERAADLEALRIIRHYLIFSARTGSHVVRHLDQGPLGRY